jgi:hypothetical protein
MAVHAVHQPIGLFLGATYPLADAVEVLFVNCGLQPECLSQTELLLQESQLRALIKGLAVAGEAELRLGLIVRLVTQLTVGLVEGRRALIPGRPGKSGRPGPAREMSEKVLEADMTATRPCGEST